MMRIGLVFLFTFLFTAASAQELNDKLIQADSLFAVQKYTEAYQHYSSIMQEDNRYSPAMLLKMAYINEGLENFDEALYYLNLYYLRTADEDVLEKMEKLAETHNLAGYEFNDWEFFKTIFYRYFNYITAFLIALAMLFMAMQIRGKFKLNKPVKGYALGMVLILTVLFYTLNFGLRYDRAVVIDENSFLMTGPSAASDVYTVIGKGHRLPVNGHEDVWIKTEWNDMPVYIKSSKIRAVTF
jgi:uncharacterized protein YgiM (DUF1202 family)